MSVQTAVSMPSASIPSRNSRAETPEPSVQPRTATSPFFRSQPAAMRPAYFAAAARSSALSLTAAVPSTTRCAPASKAASMAAMERSPPPSSTFSPERAISRTVPRLGVPPSRAPSRSTTWTQTAPAAAKSRATAAGSPL